jgi:hypothetical protein
MAATWDGNPIVTDLDSEPGIFHDTAAAVSVRHFGFDRASLKELLRRTGLASVRDLTVHTIRKTVASGDTVNFPVFMMIGRRE